MEYDELQLDTIGDKKTALFIVTSDTDSTFDFLSSMVVMQMFNTLCTKADDVYGGMLNFLTENNIMDMAGLENHLISMHNRQATILDKLKPMERRLKTLDEHIKQANLYREHSPIHRVYQQQNSKHKDEFFEKNRAPLTLFQAAERYIKAHLNGRDKIPLATWEKERATLTTERQQLNTDYVSLRNEVGKVEKIAWTVQNILYQERQREQPARKRRHDMDR